MANEKNYDINAWLEKSRRAGVSDEKIKEMLKDSGWADEQIFELLSGHTFAQPQNNNSFAPMSSINNSANGSPTITNQIGTGGALPGVFALAKQAVDLLKSRIGNFIIIILISMALGGALGLIIFFVLAGAGLAVFGFSDGANAVSIITAILGAIGIWAVVSFVFSWVQAAIMITIINRQIKIGETLSRSFKIMVSYWWLSLLMSFFIGGASMLFAIPGIIFSIWFSMAMFILISENIKGMQALLKSKEYVRGYWWAIFGRNFAISILISIPLMLITLVLSSTENNILISIFNFIVGFLAFPFMICYSYILFENLRKIKGSNIPVPQKKGGLIATSLAGWLIIPLILTFIFGFVFSGMNKKVADATRKSNISQIRIALVLYQDDQGSFPQSLDDLSPKYISSVPTDPKTGKDYEYKIFGNSQNFLVCAQLDNKDISGDTEYCLNWQGSSTDYSN